MKQLTKENFDQVISQGTVLVDCYAEWCQPCRNLLPVLEQLESTRPEPFYTLDIDTNSELSTKLGIRNIPTVKVFKDGIEVATLSGTHPPHRYIELLDNV